MDSIKINNKSLKNNFNNLTKTLKEMATQGDKVIVDLHIHTSESHESGCDLTPIETIEKLQALAQLTGKHIVFSITDHESIMGSKLALLEMEKHPELYKDITLISGIEINTSLKNIEVNENGQSTFSKAHILGLGCDVNNPEICTYSRFAHLKFRKPSTDRNVNRSKVLPAIKKLERKLKVRIPVAYFDSVIKNLNGSLYENFRAKLIEYNNLNNIGDIDKMMEIVHDILKQKYINSGNQILSAIHLIERTYNISLKYQLFASAAYKSSHIEVYDEFFKILKNVNKIVHIDNFRNLEALLADVIIRNELVNSDKSESYNKPDIIKTINMITDAGGKAVIAHPNSVQYNQKLCLGKEKYVVLQNLITKIQHKTNNKLYGLEVFHSTSFHGKAAKILFQLCKDNNLYISGGSDYHGKDTNEKIIGAVFTREFNENINAQPRTSQISNHLSYLPIVDNILYNEKVKDGFIVHSDKYGTLTEEIIKNTALAIGDKEKEIKNNPQLKNVNVRLEEDIVTDIYKGKRKVYEYAHKPKSNETKSKQCQRYIDEWEEYQEINKK